MDRLQSRKYVTLRNICWSVVFATNLREITMPKVSVIIPNYNHARFLEERIRSVLEQTYQDFEVIYLDDASTDNSNEVFMQFAGDPRIRAVYNETNSGSTFKQWNKGMHKAEGEYVWIAESDDSADKRFLEVLVDTLDKHPKVGIAYCQSWRIDKDGVVLGSMEGWTADLDATRWRGDFIEEGKEECRRYLIHRNTIPNASATLLRKTVYEQVGGASESLRLCEDWLLWAKMLLVSDIAFVAEPLNYFRTHTNTVRSSFSRRGVDIEEDYMVISFIARSLQIPEETLEAACESMASFWVSTTKRNNIPLRQQRNIYRVASQVDPKVKRRLAGKLGSYPARALRQALGMEQPVTTPLLRRSSTGKHKEQS